MRTIFLLIATLLITVNCTPRYVVTGPEVDVEEITWLVQKAAVKFKHECFFKHEHSRVLIGPDGITRLGFQFSTQDILTVNEARGLLVDFVEFVLGEINRDPLLEGQVSGYPFSPGQLDIIILCESFLPEYIDPFYIGCIKLRHGYSYFYAADEKNEELYGWHSRVEPYEDSRRFIMLERGAEREYEQAHKPPLNRIPDQYYPEEAPKR